MLCGEQIQEVFEVNTLHKMSVQQLLSFSRMHTDRTQHGVGLWASESDFDWFERFNQDGRPHDRIVDSELHVTVVFGVCPLDQNSHLYILQVIGKTKDPINKLQASNQVVLQTRSESTAWCELFVRPK